MIQTFIERANIIEPPDVSKFGKNRIRKHNGNFCHHDVLVRDVMSLDSFNNFSVLLLKVM